MFDVYLNRLKEPETIVISHLENYLLQKSREPNDRAIDVNAPSQVGKCMRENYFARIQIEPDSKTISPQLMRVFDNGHHVHDRLQKDLADSGMLIMDEIPLRHNSLNIQGHSDGIVVINKIELAILEIKSMNHFQFSKLEKATDNHRLQAMVYLLCADNRRQELQDKYNSIEEFEKDKENRFKKYKSYYKHLKSGSKFSREEKMEFQAKLHDELDNILIRLIKPITKVIILYENKNTQELKEFVIERNEEDIAYIEERYSTLNDYVEKEELPDKEGTKKSDYLCKFCNYRSICWD